MWFNRMVVVVADEHAFCPKNMTTNSYPSNATDVGVRSKAAVAADINEALSANDEAAI
jgi:hypothetical protein